MASEQGAHIPYDLHTTALYHWDKISLELLALGSDPNVKDDEGNTPLHYAARRRFTSNETERPAADTGDGGAGEETPDDDDACAKTVEVLVSNGVDVNHVNKSWQTALHVAARSNNVGLIKSLFATATLSVHVNVRDANGMMPLHLATYEGYADVVQTLISQGAKLYMTDFMGYTPLHYACIRGHAKVVSVILDNANAYDRIDGTTLTSRILQATDKQDDAPLHAAVRQGHIEICELLLSQGADVNQGGFEEQTPLHFAAAQGNVEMIKLLISHSACVNSLDSNRATPIYNAIRSYHSNAVRCLLENGADTRMPTKLTCTSLLLAARTGNDSAVKILLRNGAALSDCDKNFRNALHYACSEGHVETLQRLLTFCNGDLGYINKRDSNGNTPLHLAAAAGHDKCAEVLVQERADVIVQNKDGDTPWHLAVKNNHYNIVDTLVKTHPALVNIGDAQSNAPLHLASLNESGIVSTLCRAGASVKALNKSAWTPLHCAANKGQVEICKCLLQHGAPIDAADTIERTPLFLAAKEGHLSIVKLLIEFGGANVTKKNLFSETCLDVAIECHKRDVAKFLLNTDQWKELLRTSTSSSTPMRALIQTMPDVAEMVLDKCISITRNITYEYDITLKYEFIDDTYADWTKSLKANDTDCLTQVTGDESCSLRHPLIIMVENAPSLLAHDVVQNLLRQKWNTFGWYFYYLNLLFYLMFLFFLTGYVCISSPPYTFVAENMNHGLNCTALSCEDIASSCQQWLSSKSTAFVFFVTVGQYIVIVLSIVGFIKVLLQFLLQVMHHTLDSKLVQTFIYVSSILFVANWSDCQREVELRQPWQWKLGSLLILVAWFQLSLFVRKLPFFGIYVVMFTEILKTFLRFAPVFFLIVLGFSISFHMLFANQFRFLSLSRSILSTGVMMLGEMDYDGLFYTSEDETEAPAHFNVVYYRDAAFIVFTIFLVVMAILTTNLLIGLAVDDIKSVQREAKQTRMIMRVQLALDIEAKLPSAMRRRLVKSEEVLTIRKSRAHKYGLPAKIDAYKPKSDMVKLLKYVVLCGSDKVSDQPDVDEMEKLQSQVEEVLKYCKQPSIHPQKI